MLNVKNIIETHSLDLTKLFLDIKNGIILEYQFTTIINFYELMLNNNTNCVPSATKSYMNSLLASGYYIDYASIHRSNAITKILKDEI